MLPISMLGALNWFFCIATTLWLSTLFHSSRHLLIKPSLLLLFYTHVFFQWPLAINTWYYEQYLPDPYAFSFLIHVYVALGLLINSHTLTAECQSIWIRMTGGGESPRVSPSIVFMLSLVSLIISFTYLCQVPFTQTGLYAILKGIPDSDLVRERSLKLLDSDWVKYSYAFMRATLIPLLASMLTILLERSLQHHQYTKMFFTTFFMAGLAIVISLPGEKSAVVNLFIVIVATLLFQRGIPVNVKNVALSAFLILLPAVIVGLLQSRGDFSLSHVMEWLCLIGNRAFAGPLDVGSWYVHYLQTNAPFGVSGIPKLAPIFGAQPLDVPNVIGMLYTPARISSVSAGAGYLFMYYSFFGIFSVLLSLIGLFILDVAICVYDHLSDMLLLPCISAITLSTLSFIQSSYTTAWITHGFGVILVCSLLLDFLLGGKTSLAGGGAADSVAMKTRDAHRSSSG